MSDAPDAPDPDDLRVDLDCALAYLDAGQAGPGAEPVQVRIDELLGRLAGAGRAGDVGRSP
jgi:hypothetical protein